MRLIDVDKLMIILQDYCGANCVYIEQERQKGDVCDTCLLGDAKDYINTMPRLIDADQLLQKLQKDPLFPLVEQYGITRVIEAAPTVEAEPIRHGHWEWNDYGGFGNYHCTVCKYIPYGKFPRKFCPDYMYCPRCGAKMDEEVNENETD